MPQYSYTPHPLGGSHLLEVCDDHARLTKGSKPAVSVNYSDVKRARYFDIRSPKRHSLGVALETGEGKFLVEYTLLGPMHPDAETYLEGIRSLLQTLAAKRPDIEIESGPSPNTLLFLFLFLVVALVLVPVPVPVLVCRCGKCSDGGMRLPAAHSAW